MSASMRAWVIVAAFGLPGVWACRPSRVPDTVILVVLDAVEDSSIEQAPRLARFAAQAVRFEDHVAASTGTNAALASVVTGLPPWAHGVGSLQRRGRGRLAEGFETLAEHFRDSGYRTLAAVSLPQLRADLSGLLQGFESVFEPALDTRATWRASQTWSSMRGALEEGLRGPDPLLAMLVFCDARDPASAEPPGADILRARLAPFRAADTRIDTALALAQAQPAAALEDLEAHLGRSRGSAAWSALQAAKRDAALAGIDSHFGELLELLERTRGAAAATVCVVGLRGSITTLADARVNDAPAFAAALVEVPLLVRLAGSRKPGRVERRVQAHALLGTLIAAHGLPATPGPSSRGLPGLGVGGALQAGPVLCFDSDRSRAAAFERELQVEIEDGGEARLFRRRDGVLLARAELAPERLARLDQLTGVLTRRLAHPIWCVEAAPGADEGQAPLQIGWGFSDGEALQAEVSGPRGTWQAPGGRHGALSLVELPGALNLHGTRPDLPLRLRIGGSALAPFDPARLRLGQRSFDQLPVLWLPSTRRSADAPSEAPVEGQPWSRLAHQTGAWWRLEVSGGEGQPVRALLALYPPGPIDERLDVELAPAQGRVEVVRGRRDAVWVTGEVPLDLRVRKEPERELAQWIAVGREGLRPQCMLVGERPYAAPDEVEFYLPDWMPGVTDALDRASEEELPAGHVRITRRAQGRVSRLAFDAAELEFVRRLGDDE